jgi:Spy/CpxP family protein refolding chaperone
MKRLALVVPIVLSFVLVAIPQAESLAAESEKAENSKDAVKAKEPDAPAKEMKVMRVELDAEAQADAKARNKARKARAGQKIKNPLWWNDNGVVKALTLTDDQRKKMGAHHKSYRASVPETQKMDAFHDALKAGNWKNARAENEKTVENAIASVRMRGMLKIDILSLLSKDQLQQLAEKFPRLINKPWRRAMRSDAPEPKPDPVAKNDG